MMLFFNKNLQGLFIHKEVLYSWYEFISRRDINVLGNLQCM